jgi:hypothetical protein
MQVGKFYEYDNKIFIVISDDEIVQVGEKDRGDIYFELGETYYDLKETPYVPYTLTEMDTIHLGYLLDDDWRTLSRIRELIEL